MSLYDALAAVHPRACPPQWIDSRLRQNRKNPTALLLDKLQPMHQSHGVLGKSSNPPPEHVGLTVPGAIVGSRKDQHSFRYWPEPAVDPRTTQGPNSALRMICAALFL